MKSTRESFPHLWEASRKLMVPESFAAALPMLSQSIQQAPLESNLQNRLLDVVQQYEQQMKTRAIHQELKDLTGLPPSKALRALLVWGVLVIDETTNDPSEDLTLENFEHLLREGQNPYDILLQSSAPSLLDIGAGDLTFEQELVDQYIPQLRAQKKRLTLHAFDRLTPGSLVGGVYHKNREREQYLQNFPVEELAYHFWGGMSVGQFEKAKGALSCYTICTCHAPANPTFAYEPSRIDRQLLQHHLQSTRGDSRVSRYEGEEVLEVSHEGKVLMFPPWKFDIIGSRALLACMTQRSFVGVLSAIDDEVFWELLSQILLNPQFRPLNKIFTKDNLPEIFGDIYKALMELPIGSRIDLSKLAPIRNSKSLESTSPKKTVGTPIFQYVEIRRGAIYEGISSSFTAKQFSQMKKESTPWWIIFLSDI